MRLVEFTEDEYRALQSELRGLLDPYTWLGSQFSQNGGGLRRRLDLWGALRKLESAKKEPRAAARRLIATGAERG